MAASGWVDAQDYFVGPAVDIMRMTVLEPADLLTAIHIPGDWAGTEFYFEKLRDRQVWDFPIVNVASVKVISGGTIERIRIAVNGVAATPLRLTAVEDAVVGQPANEDTAERGGQIAIRGARPLAHNGFKVPLLRNLVKRSIRAANA